MPQLGLERWLQIPIAGKGLRMEGVGNEFWCTFNVLWGGDNIILSMLLTPSSISINGLNQIICLLRIITVLF